MNHLPTQLCNDLPAGAQSLSKVVTSKTVNKQLGNAMISVLLATVAASTLVVWQGKQMVAERKTDAAVLAARQLAQVTETLAGRIAEMEGGFTGWASGVNTADLLWLKDPTNCTLAGIPAKPSRPDGTPIVEAFLPCDFPDINESGQQYVFSWTGSWPALKASIGLGDPAVPFAFQGKADGNLGGLIARKATTITEGGREDGMHRIFVSYNYDPNTNVLSGIADNTAPVPIRPEDDPHSLHRDGSNRMAARIQWEGSNAWVGPADASDPNRAMIAGTDATVWGDNGVLVRGGTGGVNLQAHYNEIRLTSFNGNMVLDSSWHTQIQSNTINLWAPNGIRLDTNGPPVQTNTSFHAIGTIQSQGGSVIAAEVVQGKQFNATEAKGAGAWCAPVGAIARDWAGNILSCVNGVWTSPSGGSSYLAENGWAEFPGGLLVQWGVTGELTATVKGYAMDAYVTFPRPFGQVFTVSGQERKWQGAGDLHAEMVANVENVSNYGFRVNVIQVYGSGVDTMRFGWVAYGRM